MHEPDAILINGLEFYAYHGASDQEQTVGHRYVVNVRLEVDTVCAARTDMLTDTVSYSRVAKRIVEVGTEERHRLMQISCGAACQHGVRGVLTGKLNCPPG